MSFRHARFRAFRIQRFPSGPEQPAFFSFSAFRNFNFLSIPRFPSNAVFRMNRNQNPETHSNAMSSMSNFDRSVLHLTLAGHLTNNLTHT
jgi:hypothetical protein